MFASELCSFALQNVRLRGRILIGFAFILSISTASQQTNRAQYDWEYHAIRRRFRAVYCVKLGEGAERLAKPTRPFASKHGAPRLRAASTHAGSWGYGLTNYQ